MPNITLSIPPEIYEKMKKYKEVRWSEVARRAIIEYLERLEKGGLEVSSKELLEMLGKDFERRLKETPVEKYEEYYEKARKEEWRRWKALRHERNNRRRKIKEEAHRIHHDTQPRGVSSRSRARAEGVDPLLARLPPRPRNIAENGGAGKANSRC